MKKYFTNIGFAITVLWKHNQIVVVACFLSIFLRVLQPFISILIPKVIVGAVEKDTDLYNFFLQTVFILLVMIIVNFLSAYFGYKLDHDVSSLNSFEYSAILQDKIINIDYEKMQNPTIKTMEDKAMCAAEDNYTPAMTMLNTISSFITNVLGFVLYGTIISAINPLFVILILLCSIINWKLLKRGRVYEEKTRGKRSKIERKILYYINIFKDTGYSKEIRLLSVFDWITNLVNLEIHSRESEQKKLANKEAFQQLVEIFFVFTRDIFAYIFLLYMIFEDKINISDFILMFGAISSFSGWINGIINNINNVFVSNSQMNDIIMYLNIENDKRTSKINLSPNSKIAIRLDNVSYKYPGTNTYILKNINLTINEGENIAIVGQNGAGKSTLIKLICGLYKPSNGHIYINEIDTSDILFQDYVSFLAPVFQDIHLLTTSIKQNVSQQKSEDTDDVMVRECLKKSGLYEKINTLINKENTCLVKQFSKDGIDLSGGEKQKLAISRALYKNADILVLDEPTAALDPLAESEIYSIYHKLSEGKISLYVSHRLASTRFCDYIIVLDKGSISEVGTHEELIQSSGKYSEMYAIQSNYYVSREADYKVSVPS